MLPADVTLPVILDRIYATLANYKHAKLRVSARRHVAVDGEVHPVVDARPQIEPVVTEYTRLLVYKALI